MNTKEMLENSMKEFLLKRNNEWHTPKVGVYHASGIWGCKRKQYLSFISPKPHSVESLGACEMGTVIHDFMQGKVLKDKIVSMEESIHIPIENGVQIVGRYDMLGCDSEGAYLVDFKSTAWLKDDKVDASEHHKVQANIYLHALGIERGFIYEISKKNLLIKVFEVKYDPDLFELTRLRALEVDKAIKLLECPAKDPQASWECNPKFCPYAEECLKLEEGKSDGANKQ